jgi:hypothetical protein
MLAPLACECRFDSGKGSNIQFDDADAAWPDVPLPVKQANTAQNRVKS